MPVVSVINYKGGVGKTTVVANLAGELAYRGKKVLMMDMDPQASLTFSFVKPDYWQSTLSTGGTILDWYQSFDSKSPLALESLVMTPPQVNRWIQDGQLDLIPSHLGLINVDLELASELGGNSMAQVKKKYLSVHRRLADALADPAFDDYDVVLMDCPPNFNIVTKTAIVASDQVLIPAKADYLSTMGIDYLRRSLNELVTDYNDWITHGDDHGEPIDPKILGVVFTMIQFYAKKPIQAHQSFISEVKKLGVDCFKSYVRENKTLYADAPQFGVPVVLNGRATQSHILREMEAVATEFAKRAGV
jgi:chromosome partitioning protein